MGAGDAVAERHSLASNTPGCFSDFGGKILTQAELLAEELEGLCDSGYTPLMQAVRQRDRNQVESLLLEGADVNVTGRKGLTALILSVGAGNSDITRILLEFGADTSAADMRGKTALHHAARAGDEVTVTFLLEHGAYPNVVANTEATPLIYTVLERRWEIMALLLKWGALVEVPQRQQVRSALFTAVSGYDPEGSRLAAIPALLAAGANPCLRDAQGFTASQRLRVGYEQIRRSAPLKAKGMIDRSDQWAEREERYAQAVKLLEQAERNTD